MKWINKDKYHIESVGKDNLFSISKSKVYGKVTYCLWKLPYSKPEFIFKSENIEEVKQRAIHYVEA